MKRRECDHAVVLYGTKDGGLRPENAVCAYCRERVTVDFCAPDRAPAFAAVLIPSPAIAGRRHGRAAKEGAGT